MDAGKHTQGESEDEPARHHYHYLQAFSGSFVLIAPAEDVKTAVVFVHGFGGDACETWAQFQLIIDDDETWRERFLKADLYFFQYWSALERIGSSVNRLLTFVDELVLTPDEKHFGVAINPISVPLLIRADDARSEPVLVSALPEARCYEKVILVGHSEGGVVIRQAVLESDLDQPTTRPLLLHSALALFAPAIFGYNPTGLLGTLANFPGLGRVIDAFLQASPAYQDLKHRDILKPLQRATEARQAQKDRASGFFASILWGRKDRIVQDGKYQKDTRDYEDDCGHVAICKPRDGYDRPVKLIAGLI